jgi:hypothetical protein
MEPDPFAFHLDFVSIQWPWCRSGNDAAVDRESRTVTGTSKLPLGWLPMVSAAEMGAPRRKDRERPLGVLHGPGIRLFAVDLPAVNSAMPEGEFF